MASASSPGIGHSRAGGSAVAADDWMRDGAGRTTKSLLRWGLVLLLALAFKQYYALAETGQLQWLLRPLAGLLNGTGLFAFAPTGAGEWLDASHGLAIVKACAGGNFLIASWLGYLWRWRDQPLGVALVLRSLGAAWLTTLAANAARIVLIAYGQDDLSRIAGLTAADSHRLIGIAVYFGVLGLQLIGAGALLMAPMIYLAVTVLVPLLNAWLSGRNGIETGHALWTAAVPLAGLLAYGVARHRRRVAEQPGAGAIRAGSGTAVERQVDVAVRVDALHPDRVPP